MELREDTVIVVLGASGDLAKKKTVCSSPSYGTNVEANRSQFPALFGLVGQQEANP